MAHNDLILFVAAATYFGTMMFDRHPRVATILSGILLLGSAGTVVIDTRFDETFRTISTVAIACILFRRSWIEWRR